MNFIWIASLCFLLFFVYDINSILWKKNWIHTFFLLGCILLGVTTVYAACVLSSLSGISDIVQIVGWILLVVFMILLIHTLFFALPFEDTYVDDLKDKSDSQKERRPIYKEGMYALCRHPGVLWFAGVYLSLCLARPSTGMITLGISATAWNVAYVIFQDIWTFPLLFTDYDSYRKDTPFLLPNIRSVSKCMNTLIRKDTN